MPAFILNPVAGTAATALVGTTVPLGSTRKVNYMSVYNGTGAVVSLEVYYVPSGGTAVQLTRKLLRNVANNDTDLCSELIGITMEAGSGIHIKGLSLSFSYSGIDSVV